MLYFSDDSVIRTVDGKILHKYKHPAAVFGCDWSQNNKYDLYRRQYEVSRRVPPILPSPSFQGHDSNRLRGQKRAGLLPGHKFGAALEGLYRTPR